MNPKKDIFATSKGKWDFTIAVIVIVIFSVFIYQFLFNKTEEQTKVVTAPSESSTPKIVSTTISNKDEEPQYLYTNSDIYEATDIQVEDAYESDKKIAVVISDIKKSKSIETDSISKALNSANKTKLPFATQKKVADSIASDEFKKKESSLELEEKIIPKTTTEKPAVATKIESTKTNPTMNCVAIVGVFKEANNKTAVIQKLKSLGHLPTEGVLREGLIYVGVPVACENKQERQKLLSKLNQDFGINSWVKKI